MSPQLTRIHRVAIAAALTCLLLLATAGSASASPAQDFRNPDNRAETSSSAANAWPHQDLRSPDARDAAMSQLPQAPTWPVDPKPITSAPAAEPTAAGGGVDWVMIALGGVAALLVSGAAVALVAHSRRTHRVRVSA